MRNVYHTLSRGVHMLMDGGDPNSFDGVLFRPPAVAAYGAPLSAIYSLALGYAHIQNRTGGLIVCGIGGRHHPMMWRAGQWVDATTTYTEDQVDAKDVDANDFPLETLTNNDGFLLATRFPANCICLNIGTASVGGTPTRTIEYSKAGGSWGTITNALIPPVTTAHWATGENVILFNNPTDLAVMEAGHGTNVPIGFYGYRFRSTVAPTTTAAVVHSLSVASVIRAIETLADNNLYELNPAGGEHRFDPCCDSLVAVLSSKGAIQSTVSVETRVA